MVAKGETPGRQAKEFCLSDTVNFSWVAAHSTDDFDEDNPDDATLEYSITLTPRHYV